MQFIRTAWQKMQWKLPGSARFARAARRKPWYFLPGGPNKFYFLPRGPAWQPMEALQHPPTSIANPTGSLSSDIPTNYAKVAGLHNSGPCSPNELTIQ